MKSFADLAVWIFPGAGIGAMPHCPALPLSRIPHTYFDIAKSTMLRYRVAVLYPKGYFSLFIARAADDDGACLAGRCPDSQYAQNI